MSTKLFNFLLLLLPAVLYFGYISPAYSGNEGFVWTPTKGITGLQAERVQYQNSINQLDLIKTEMEKIASDYKKVPPEVIEKMSIMVPDTIDQVKVRNEIVTIAAKSNIAIQNLRVEKDVKGGDRGLNFYAVSFDVKSRYPAFKKFMEEYEKNQRFFILESASIKRQEQQEGEQKSAIDFDEALNMQVNSRIYYMK